MAKTNHNDKPVQLGADETSNISRKIYIQIYSQAYLEFCATVNLKTAEDV